MEDILMKYVFGLVVAGAMMATTAFAHEHMVWKSVDADSSVAFGSVKKDTVGEVHHFEHVNGTGNKAGEVEISIDLTSVETNIDIRNERMMKYVFGDAAQATLSGSVDMEAVMGLAVGETMIADFEGKLSLLAQTAYVDAEMLVARLSETRVLVSTADFIMLETEELGVNAGVDKLMELAKLPGITRVTPVSVRMVFEK
jgi:hypothetical protein